MKKLLTGVVAAFALLTSGATIAETKIAVINVAEVFQQIPQREAISRQLKDEFEVRVQQVRGTEAKIQALLERREKDGALMGDDELIQIKRDLEKLDSEYKRLRREVEEDQRRRGAEEQQRLMIQIQDAVTAVAKSEKIDLVMPLDATAYFNPQLDITQKVINQVSKAQ